MKGFSLELVLNKLPVSISLFLLGLLLGSILEVALFFLDRKIVETIIFLWSKKVLFGIEILGTKYSIVWFFLNNLFALLLVITAFFFIITLRERTPTFLLSRKLKEVRKRRTKITLIGLYMIPTGALIINGFFISFLLFFLLLTRGVEKFLVALILLLPHGITELPALLLACSLGLSYLEILSPLILKSRWKETIQISKKLLKSRVTFLILLAVFILLGMSGMIEGILTFYLVP